MILPAAPNVVAIDEIAALIEPVGFGIEFGNLSGGQDAADDDETILDVLPDGRRLQPPLSRCLAHGELPLAHA